VREVIRDRIIHVILVLGFIAILSIRLIAPLSLGEEMRLVRDFGLSMISISGILVTVFISTRLVYDEIQRKTIYTIVTKSVSRWEFIFGKYLGVSTAIFLITLVLSLVFIGYMLLFGLPITTNLLIAVFLQFLELLLVSAIAILFSTFVSPISSGIFTFALYFIGHFTSDLLILGEIGKIKTVKYLATFFYYILPNLSYFNIRSEAVHNIPITFNHIFFSSAYGLAYIIVLLSMAILIFERKDL